MNSVSNHELPTEVQKYIHLSKYARYLEDKGRRETWEETVDRYCKYLHKIVEESPASEEDKKIMHEAIG